MLSFVISSKLIATQASKCSSQEYQKLMTKVILISATVYNQFWEKILRLQI